MKKFVKFELSIYAHLYSSPPMDVTQWNFAEVFGIRRFPGLSWDVVCVILRLVTDRQRDRRTTAYTVLAASLVNKSV